MRARTLLRRLYGSPAPASCLLHQLVEQSVDVGINDNVPHGPAQALFLRWLIGPTRVTGKVGIRIQTGSLPT